MDISKTDIRLSVMVPVYNVESFIRRTLDSLMAQTYRNLEIIIVDDGSTDKSGQICDECAQLDPRIIVIHKKNGGIVSARKAAVREATGDYIINCDSDDWIEQDAYEHVMEIVRKYHPDMVAFGMTKEYDGFTEKYPLEFSEGYYKAEEFWSVFNHSVDANLFFKQPLDMSQCNKAVRTELLKRQELNCSEKLKKNVDDAVIWPCLLEMKDIYISSGCWYHYCVRKTSILWKSDERDYERYLTLAKTLLIAVKENNNGHKVSKEFVLYKLFHHLILDVPERMFQKEKCLIYPQMLPGCKVVVYGKGVFANRMMTCIREMDYCRIVENIDSGDVERLKSINADSYDYIVVALFNAGIVESVLNTLKEYDIPEDKILIIDKAGLSKDILPFEIAELCVGI